MNFYRLIPVFNILIIINIFLLVPLITYGQQEISPRVVCLFPDQVLESSGLYIQRADSIWSQNDSGNNRKLYLIDTFGTKIRNVEMVGGGNIDWEDLATDSDGNIYIGDFGNNFEDRQDLVIYKSINPALIGTETFFAETINFHYEDQNAFPPPIQQWYFDCEAMLVWSDTIFIFTKDYSVPYNGFTRMYHLPNTPGDHTAIFSGVFYTDNDNFYEGSITGAALSPDRSKMALISNRKLWVFYDFEGQNFFNGSVKEFKFAENTQKEAVAFLNECEMYISDEQTNDGGGKLYAFNVCDYLAATDDVVSIEKSILISQDNNYLYFDAGSISEAFNPAARIYLWDTKGSKMGEMPLSYGKAAFSKTTLTKNQVYFYTLYAPSLTVPVAGKILAW